MVQIARPGVQMVGSGGSERCDAAIGGHRGSRLHDRLRYRREKDGAWVVERLAP